jgi:hypothetical protein
MRLSPMSATQRAAIQKVSGTAKARPPLNPERLYFSVWLSLSFGDEDAGSLRRPYGASECISRAREREAISARGRLMCSVGCIHRCGEVA